MPSPVEDTTKSPTAALAVNCFPHIEVDMAKWIHLSSW
jgi:hypothetical protein